MQDRAIKKEEVPVWLWANKRLHDLPFLDALRRIFILGKEGQE